MGAAPREQGHAPGVTPLARSCQGFRGLVGGVSGVGEEDDTMDGVADVRGPCGSGCRRGESGVWAGCVGRER